MHVVTVFPGIPSAISMPLTRFEVSLFHSSNDRLHIFRKMTNRSAVPLISDESIKLG